MLMLSSNDHCFLKLATDFQLTVSNIFPHKNTALILLNLENEQLVDYIIFLTEIT